MLHVLSDPLQEAQWLIEGNWHRNLGQLLEENIWLGFWGS